MSIFDVIIVQPIFNALLFIYSIVGDFGVSIILFTIIIRMLMWPLINRQLHQTKLMRKIQPELKKIKKQTKGNRQLETQMMMELYRERGVKPFSSIAMLLVQLPIFIGIYVVINTITNHRDQIDKYFYEAVKNLPSVQDIVASNHQFDETFLGVIDLTQTVFSNGTFHFSIFILAALAGIFQYIQTKQIMPKSGEQKRLRDILKDASSGKEADQAEITAAMSNKMALLMPLMLFAFSFYLPAAVVLYYATSSLVAIGQQYLALKEDEEELIELANEVVKQPRERQGKNGTVVRIKTAKEAKITKKAPATKKKSSKKRG